ncbi:septum site-determining protein (MIND) [Quillaja saponaria]|uniref:Septum site-determining protein (MIND) n=1 Tax=Quillaja saponaria TaxID=32244 RepID=A0AAD7Q3U1_QUISA|nr:septum site-determining protein (MIND) [Quillaja saponaria]
MSASRLPFLASLWSPLMLMSDSETWTSCLALRTACTVVEVLNGDCRVDQALVRDKRWSNFELLCISKPRPPTLAGLPFEQAAWRFLEQDSMKAVMVEP